MSICANCGLPTGDNDNGATEICNPCTNLGKKESAIRVTPLKRDDLELVLAWRSNPKIFEYFREQNSPLDWNEHVSWFESRASERYDFIIHYEGRRVGAVSIDQDDEVGTYLGDFSAHGQGVATEALNWLCDRFEHRTPLFAEIFEDNAASKRLFRRCGFRQIDQEGKWLEYAHDP